MKNKYYLLFIAMLFIVLFSCSDDDEKEIVKDKYLSEITIQAIVYEYGRPSTNAVIGLYRYDINGNLVQKDSISRSFAGIYLQYYTYRYNENNQLIEMKELDKRTDYFYDNAGLLIEEKIYGKYGINKIIKYSYKGNKLYKQEESEAIVNYYSIYEYDSKGLLDLKKKYRVDDNSLFYSYKYEYDLYDNLIKETTISSEGSEQIVKDYQYSYDEDGKIIQRTSKNLYGEIEEIRDYMYDEQNRINEIKYYDEKKINIKYSDSYFYKYKEY